MTKHENCTLHRMFNPHGFKVGKSCSGKNSFRLCFFSKTGRLEDWKTRDCYTLVKPAIPGLNPQLIQIPSQIRSRITDNGKRNRITEYGIRITDNGFLTIHHSPLTTHLSLLTIFAPWIPITIPQLLNKRLNVWALSIVVFLRLISLKKRHRVSKTG